MSSTGGSGRFSRPVGFSLSMPPRNLALTLIPVNVPDSRASQPMALSPTHSSMGQAWYGCLRFALGNLCISGKAGDTSDLVLLIKMGICLFLTDDGRSLSADTWMPAPPGRLHSLEALISDIFAKDTRYYDGSLARTALDILQKWDMYAIPAPAAKTLSILLHLLSPALFEGNFLSKTASAGRTGYWGTYKPKDSAVSKTASFW